MIKFSVMYPILIDVYSFDMRTLVFSIVIIPVLIWLSIAKEKELTCYQYQCAGNGKNSKKDTEDCVQTAVKNVQTCVAGQVQYILNQTVEGAPNEYILTDHYVSRRCYQSSRMLKENGEIKKHVIYGGCYPNIDPLHKHWISYVHKIGSCVAYANKHWLGKMCSCDTSHCNSAMLLTWSKSLVTILSVVWLANQFRFFYLIAKG